MNIQSLFQTEAERKEARSHFISLKENDDWKFLCDNVIQAYINDITNNILDRDYEWKGTEENEAKRIREHWILLKKLPEELLKTLIEPKEEEETNEDPYFKKLKR